MATIKVDVHYYEDGNVRMTTSKKAEISSTSGGAEAIVREIVKLENAFQEQLNRAFGTLAEGSFKALRRQLPVTRQRVEWEKIGGYRVSDYVCCRRDHCHADRMTVAGTRCCWWATAVDHSYRNDDDHVVNMVDEAWG